MARRLLLILAVVVARAAGAEAFKVDPDSGNSTFSAVFESALGERITANSSAVSCLLNYDQAAGLVSGSCSVQLPSVRVDNDDTKTEHFGQWATNKKSDPKACTLEARFERVKVAQLKPEVPVRFAAAIPFTICGKARTDGGKEQLVGRLTLLPAGTYGEATTVRVRATIEHFKRSQYQVGPQFTDGWLARVQSLAKVVADEGSIELSLFAAAQPLAPSK
jgi:hypothetical protein